MGTKKWSEIKKLSKASDADRAEAHAELAAELARTAPPPHGTVREILDNADALADWFEAFDPADGIERPIEEYREERQRKSQINVGNEFGTAAPRGRPVIDRQALDRQLAELAGHPVSLPAGAVGYEAPYTCPACGSTEILWGCDDEVHHTELTIHPVVWHATEQMADSYVCRTCLAGWIEPDEPDAIFWVRPYWIES